LSEFDSVKYRNTFAKENYDRISLFVNRGEKEYIRKFAKESNCSLNGFIVQAVYEKIERMEKK